MKNNNLSKTPELSPVTPTPFFSSAKLVIGVGLGVLGLIGKAIKGAAALLVKRPDNASSTGVPPVNNSDSIQHQSDL